MKTLANCKPSEFVAQTYKIKKAVWNWLDITKVLEIRKTAPEGLVKISEDMTMEQKGEALTKNKELIFAQAKKNLSEILDSMLGEHPDETLELMALICFIEPEDIDNHPMNELLANINEIIGDEAVLGFFSLLMRSGQTDSQKQ